MTYHDWLPWVGIVVVAGSLAAMLVLARNAPLYDENERPVDEVQDDPRPAQVLRDGWADRETRGVGLRAGLCAGSHPVLPVR